MSDSLTDVLGLAVGLVILDKVLKPKPMPKVKPMKKIDWKPKK